MAVKEALPQHTGLASKMARLDANIAPAATPAAPAEPATPAPAAAAPVAPVGEKPEETPPAQEAKPFDIDSLTDEQVAELVAKRTGSKIKTLDELKPAPIALTPKEQEELAEKEKAESLEWGLSSQKISKDLYDKAIVERSKDRRDIALALFTAEQQADNKDLSAEDCAQMFSDAMFEDEPENSWKRKRALKEMNTLVDNHLAQYNVIDALPEEFRAYKTTTEAQKSYDKTIKAVAKELPKDLAFKIPYTSVDGASQEIEYSVPVNDKVLQGIVKEFSTPEMFAGLGDVKPEVLNAEFLYHVRARMLDEAIPQIMAKHAERVEEDVMSKLKNARNPHQPIGGVIAPEAEPKAPPAHTGLAGKMNK